MKKEKDDIRPLWRREIIIKHINLSIIMRKASLGMERTNDDDDLRIMLEAWKSSRLDYQPLFRK